MKIKVEYKNDILGNGLFWEGDSSEIATIRNYPAKLLAREVVKDGATRKSGMWIVSAEEVPDGD